MSAFWQSRRVLLTGGGGFLGGYLREQLEILEPEALFAPRSAALDLRDARAVAEFLRESRPSLIIHAAAVVGGIGANRAHPGRFFYENALIGIQLIEAARLAGVEKFVCLGTVCAYPKSTPIPFHEDDLWNGYPEATNAPYGLAKKMLLVQLQAYRQEYGFNGVYLLPANLYGPRDHFDLETSHVIPAMIRKFAEAGGSTVRLWGDGTPTREFLYVEDAAAGILDAAERYDSSDPVNLGSGLEMTIGALADQIGAAMGYRGRFVWDASKPNGQPRRALEVSRARERFGWTAKVSFDEGLQHTIRWWKENRT
ncbi:MAG TPA: GDP-L-fucose synthase [Thermoanaerobaculia bacterium]|nr:GDP-L-fucose synthase [Thermoanaerobaculia bacterium]